MKNLKRHSLLFLFAMSIIVSSFNCKSYRSVKANSFNQIEMLKDNVLLVRLKESENKLKVLRESGNTAELKELETEIVEGNKETLDAFSKHFDFCKVYFFKSSDAGALRDKSYEKVQFFDNKMDAVDTKIIKKDQYLITSFDYSYADVMVYEKDKERHQVAGTNSRSALVVMDKDYIQLKKPFPFRVINSYRENNKRSVVRELNRNLHNFYSKAKRRRG